MEARFFAGGATERHGEKAMTDRQWAVLGFRLLGLWLIVGPAQDWVALAVLALVQRGPAQVTSREVAYSATSMVIAVSLWRWAGWLASRTFPEATVVGRSPVARSDEQLLAPALSIIGVYLIALAIPDVLSGVVAFVGSGDMDRSVFGGQGELARMWRVKTTAEGLFALARTLIGVALLLYASRLSAVVVALRRHQDSTDSSTDDEQPTEEQAQGGDSDRT